MNILGYLNSDKRLDRQSWLVGSGWGECRLDLVDKLLAKCRCRHGERWHLGLILQGAAAAYLSEEETKYYLKMKRIEFHANSLPGRRRETGRWCGARRPRGCRCSGRGGSPGRKLCVS